MNAITMPGFGDEATWGACTGHALDPRTAASAFDSEADDLQTCIDDAVQTLEAADPHNAFDAAQAAMREAGCLLLTANDVPELLRSGSVISSAQAAAIVKCMASMLAAGSTVERSATDPAITALDQAAELLSQRGAQ